ncbi:DNA primase [Streptomyces sp. Ru87]|nr:DNA primase [Streptomyces sp. Ru87]
MTNRLAMALAVTAGYVLGRTKKAKLAIGLGGMVLGKRLKLNPQQLTGLVTEQLKNNPQLGEVRDQLRGDLRGVGRAATGALVTRQLDSLADRLHDRTLGVRDRLTAGGDGTGAAGDGGRGDEREDAEPGDDAYEAPESEPERPRERSSGARPPERRRPAKKAAAGKPETGTSAGRTATGRTSTGKTAAGSAGRTGAKQGAAKRAPAGKRAASAAGGTKKATAPADRTAKKTAKKTAARRSGGGGRG